MPRSFRYGSREIIPENIWASSWENLFLPYANNKDADQTAHPRSLIGVFVIRCLDSMISLVSISKMSSRLLASEAEQAVWVIPGRKPRRQVFSWCGSYSVAIWLCLLCIWAGPWENVSYVICEQQRRRSACASAQSDQHLCCSLLR